MLPCWANTKVRAKPEKQWLGLKTPEDESCPAGSGWFRWLQVVAWGLRGVAELFRGGRAAQVPDRTAGLAVGADVLTGSQVETSWQERGEMARTELSTVGNAGRTERGQKWGGSGRPRVPAVSLWLSWSES